MQCVQLYFVIDNIPTLLLLNSQSLDVQCFRAVVLIKLSAVLLLFNQVIQL